MLPRVRARVAGRAERCARESACVRECVRTFCELACQRFRLSVNRLSLPAAASFFSFLLWARITSSSSLPASQPASVVCLAAYRHGLSRGCVCVCVRVGLPVRGLACWRPCRPSSQHACQANVFRLVIPPAYLPICQPAHLCQLGCVAQRRFASVCWDWEGSERAKTHCRQRCPARAAGRALEQRPGQPLECQDCSRFCRGLASSKSSEPTKRSAQAFPQLSARAAVRRQGVQNALVAAACCVLVAGRGCAPERLTAGRVHRPAVRCAWRAAAATALP